MDGGTRKRERGASSAQENQKKQPKVQYSPSRWPSTSPESEVEELYMPKLLTAVNLPLDVTEKEVKFFFKSRVKKVELFIDDKDKNNIIRHSIISFVSAEEATKGLKRNGKMLRGKSIYVTRQKSDREIVSVSGFTGMTKKNMKKKLRTAFKPRGEVLKIFLPTNSTTGLCLGFGYIYMNLKGKKPKDGEEKLLDSITISDVQVHVRGSTMRKSYLCELLGKKNVSKTEKTRLKKPCKKNVSKTERTRLKKLLLPIPNGLHNLSANTFSWEDTTPKILPEAESVEQEFDDCWAVALTSHYNSLLKLRGECEQPLTLDQLKKGVGLAHGVSSKGIERLKVVAPFMKSLGCDMHVYHRPMGDAVEEFEDFEKFIERLLEKGPAAVVVEYSPGFESFNGEGVYLPTDVDIYQVTFEKFVMHCLLLTGYGVEDGKQYWRLLDSQGEDWGDRGFIKMERHKCLIKSVVELKIKGQDV